MMSMTFQIDDNECRNGNPMPEIYDRLRSYARAGWKLDELFDAEGEMPVGFTVKFDDARDASEFWFWRVKTRRSRKS